MNRILSDLFGKSLCFQLQHNGYLAVSLKPAVFFSKQMVLVHRQICNYGLSAMFAQKSNSFTPSSSYPKAQKKSKETPKITLIGQNQSMSVTTLEEAQKMARRRDLRLVQLEDIDTKTQRPAYKLVTTGEFLSEDNPDKSKKSLKGAASDKDKSSTAAATKKSEKSLTIGCRISDHDLSSRLKNIAKWLTKNHEIRILVQGGAGETANCEKIFNAIEKTIKEPEIIGKVAQKRSKNSFIKFSIIPVLAKKEDNERLSA